MDRIYRNSRALRYASWARDYRSDENLDQDFNSQLQHPNHQYSTTNGDSPNGSAAKEAIILPQRDYSSLESNQNDLVVGSNKTVVHYPVEKTEKEWRRDSQKQFWLGAIQGFATESTLQGLKYAAAERNTVLRRILWVVIFLCCTGLLLYLTIEKIDRLLSYPKSVAVSYNYLESLPYPAITICNENQYRLTAVQEQGLYDLLTDVNSNNVSSAQTGNDTYWLLPGICSLPAEFVTGWKSTFLVNVVDVTRSVCRSLCSSVYNNTCSGFLYFQSNNSCILSPYTGNWLYMNSTNCSTVTQIEFYQRQRYIGATYIYCNFETESPLCTMASNTSAMEPWIIVRAQGLVPGVDVTLNQGVGMIANLLTTSLRLSYTSRFSSGYMNTSGTCLELFYVLLSDYSLTSLSIITISEELDENLVYKTTRTINDWTYLFVQLPAGINTVVIQSVRAFSGSSSISLDDITIQPCSNFSADKECKVGALGRGYLGNQAVTESNLTCLQWTTFSKSYSSLLPDSNADDAKNYCRYIAGSNWPGPSCLVFVLNSTIEITIDRCKIPYCTGCRDPTDLKCGNGMCVPDFECSGIQYCSDGSSNQLFCSGYISVKCNFSSSFACGYQSTALNTLSWQWQAAPATGSGNSFMTVSSALGQLGDRVSLISPQWSLNQSSSLIFNYMIQQSASQSSQLYVMQYSVLNYPLGQFLVNIVADGAQHSVSICIPEGTYLIVFMAELGTPFTSDIFMYSVNIVEEDCSPVNWVIRNQAMPENMCLFMFGNLSCNASHPTTIVTSTSAFFSWTLNVDSYDVLCDDNGVDGKLCNSLNQSIITRNSDPCNGGAVIYASLFGEIVSVNYPYNYSTNLFCVYQITSPNNESFVVIDFQSFDVEFEANCVYDFLEISCITEMNAKPVLVGRYCGEALPPMLNLNCIALNITFTSDNSITGKGFDMKFFYNTQGVLPGMVSKLQLISNQMEASFGYNHTIQMISPVHPALEGPGCLIMNFAALTSCMVWLAYEANSTSMSYFLERNMYSLGHVWQHLSIAISPQMMLNQEFVVILEMNVTQQGVIGYIKDLIISDIPCDTKPLAADDYQCDVFSGVCNTSVYWDNSTGPDHWFLVPDSYDDYSLVTYPFFSCNFDGNGASEVRLISPVVDTTQWTIENVTVGFFITSIDIGFDILVRSLNGTTVNKVSAPVDDYQLAFVQNGSVTSSLQNTLSVDIPPNGLYYLVLVAYVSHLSTTVSQLSIPWIESDVSVLDQEPVGLSCQFESKTICGYTVGTYWKRVFHQDSSNISLTFSSQSSNSNPNYFDKILMTPLVNISSKSSFIINLSYNQTLTPDSCVLVYMASALGHLTSTLLYKLGGCGNNSVGSLDIALCLPAGQYRLAFIVQKIDSLSISSVEFIPQGDCNITDIPYLTNMTSSVDAGGTFTSWVSSKWSITQNPTFIIDSVHREKVQVDYSYNEEAMDCTLDDPDDYWQFTLYVLSAFDSTIFLGFNVNSSFCNFTITAAINNTYLTTEFLISHEAFSVYSDVGTWQITLPQACFVQESTISLFYDIPSSNSQVNYHQLSTPPSKLPIGEWASEVLNDNPLSSAVCFTFQANIVGDLTVNISYSDSAYIGIPPEVTVYQLINADAINIYLELTIDLSWMSAGQQYQVIAYMYSQSSSSHATLIQQAALKDGLCKRYDYYYYVYENTTNYSTTNASCAFNKFDACYYTDASLNTSRWMLVKKVDTTVVDAATCLKSGDPGFSYTGYLNTTFSGRICQYWNSQQPHKHLFTSASDFADGVDGLNSNYCRNPYSAVDYAQPWCFTMDENQTMEYCNIPTCYLEYIMVSFGMDTVSSTLISEVFTLNEPGCLSFDYNISSDAIVLNITMAVDGTTLSSTVFEYKNQTIFSGWNSGSVNLQSGTMQVWFIGDKALFTLSPGDFLMLDNVLVQSGACVQNESVVSKTITYDGVPQEMYSYMGHIYENLRESGVLMNNLTTLLGPTFNDLIYSCQFAGAQCNESFFFVEQTAMGQCFTFNRNSVGRLNASIAGSQSGLSLTFNVEQYENMNIFSQQKAGVKIDLYNQADISALPDSGYSVPAGFAILMSISYTEFSDIGAPYGEPYPCVDNQVLQFYNSPDEEYTSYKCQMDLNVIAINESCHCKNVYMPSSIVMCDLQSYLDCSMNFVAQPLNLNTECPSACKQELFKPIISFAQLSTAAAGSIITDVPAIQEQLNNALEVSARVDDAIMTDLFAQLTALSSNLQMLISQLEFQVSNGNTSVISGLYTAIQSFKSVMVKDLNSFGKEVLDSLLVRYNAMAASQVSAGTSQIMTLQHTLADLLYASNHSTGQIEHFSNSSQAALQSLLQLMNTTLDFALGNSGIISLVANQSKELSCIDVQNNMNTVLVSESLLFSFESFMYDTEAVNSNTSSTSVLVQQLMTNLSLLATCFTEYEQVLLKAQNWLTTSTQGTSFSLAAIVSENIIDSLQTILLWTQQNMDSYAANQVTKLQLARNFTSMLPTINNQIGNVGSQIVQQIIADQSAVTTYISSYTNLLSELMNYITLMSRYLEDPLVNSLTNFARGLVIWQQPLPQFQTEQAIVYNLQASDIAKVWPMRVTLFTFNSTMALNIISSNVNAFQTALIAESTQFTDDLTTTVNTVNNLLSNITVTLAAYQLSSNVDANFVLNNFLTVNIFYENLEYESIDAEPAYDIEQFFAEVGGFLGLCIGGSIITLFEILDLFLYNAYRRATGQ